MINAFGFRVGGGSLPRAAQRHAEVQVLGASAAVGGALAARARRHGGLEDGAPLRGAVGVGSTEAEAQQEGVAELRSFTSSIQYSIA